VDDEPLAIEALVNLIGKIPGMEILGTCRDAVEALQLIREKEFDLVFLDIHMPELSGLEMLRSLSRPPKVIFTTAYREYAADAFELDVVDYLLKPISFERLLKAINRYHDRSVIKPDHAEGKISSITIYADKKTHRIPAKDILFVEGLKDYAIVHTRGGRLVTRQTMKNIGELLVDFGFIRVHRSWIVPLSGIRSWTGYSLYIGEKEIPIGKTYRHRILELLKDPESGT
jgi:DNA-binding LytR/AlgR family response regulator